MNWALLGAVAAALVAYKIAQVLVRDWLVNRWTAMIASVGLPPMTPRLLRFVGACFGWAWPGIILYYALVMSVPVAVNIMRLTRAGRAWHVGLLDDLHDWKVAAGFIKPEDEIDDEIDGGPL